MKDKGFKILFGICIFMMIADIVSTVINGEIVQHTEANPLYGSIGLTGIVILNILVFGIYYWIYTQTSKPFTRYSILFVMTLICLVRMSVIYNNFQWYQFSQSDPVATISAAKAVTVQMKQETIKRIVGLTVFPLFTNIILYPFFKADHNIEVKEC